MKIALAQVRSESGHIDLNIKKHLRYIDAAALHRSDLIVFPELSITGYEPTRAEQLAFEASDIRLTVFQKVSNKYQMTIAVGVPLRKDESVSIAMILFQPRQDPIQYSKRYLHDDELPYFKAGREQSILKYKDHVLAPAICYESRILQHAQDAAELGAQVYLVSAAKPHLGLEKAGKHYPVIAKKYGYTVLLANSVGPADNFIGAGKSGIWLPDGSVLTRLSETEEALLIYDLNNQEVTIEKPEHMGTNITHEEL